MQELVPYVSCLCSEAEFSEVVKGHHAEIYVPVKEGFLKHVKLSGGRSVRIKVDKLPAGAKLEAEPVIVNEELNFLPAGKIPYEFFEQIVEFFRQVSKKMKAEFEAHAWILWTAEKGYFISVPKQSVSKASVLFTYDDDSLPPGSVIVCDIHSHNTMSSFYSQTDDNNDKSGIYYSAVIGKLTDDSFEYVIRFNLYEQKKKCMLGEVFEIPEPKKAVVPQEWLDQVEMKTFTPTAPAKYSGQNNRSVSMWDQRANALGFEEVWPGFDKKGLGGTKNPGKKAKTTTEEDASTEWPYTLQRDLDLPDMDDFGGLIDLESEVTFEGASAEAAEAYQLIDDFLVSLEECDEPLLDIMRQCHGLLTDSGRMKIATNGIN